jgi:uncharacterized membrane protein
MNDDQLLEAVHFVTRMVEMAGIGVMLTGGIVSLALFTMALARDKATAAIAGFRSNLGRSILLGLEFLVAADIIDTVAIEPTLESVAVLAGIVLIRTFLSFSLELEIEGRWPWERKSGGAERPT